MVRKIIPVCSKMIVSCVEFFAFTIVTCEYSAHLIAQFLAELIELIKLVVERDVDFSRGSVRHSLRLAGIERGLARSNAASQ